MNALINATPAEPVAFNFDASVIRAIQINDEPWFVASDVAALLEYRDAPSMTRMLDDDEKGTHYLRTLGGVQLLTIVNESGLFSAILSSRKPEAKRVKKWVTSDVLPSIRKTGQYRTQPTAELSRLEILQMAIEAEKANIQLTTQLAIAAPKAQALDLISDATGLFGVREAAKTLKITQSELTTLLIDRQWMYRDGRNVLQGYAHRIEQGCIKHVMSAPIADKVGVEHVYSAAKITTKGMTRLARILAKVAA